MIKHLKPKSEFSRNVLTLMTGTTIAQALPIAAAPILTRMYSPENFGVFAFYLAIVSIMAILATARYELAIVLPKSRDDAYQIVILSCGITIVISLMILLLIFLFESNITGMLDNQALSNWLYWIPFSIFLMGIYQSLYYWNNREKSYVNMANSRVVQNSTMVGTQVGLGFIAKLSAFGLILGQVIGQVLVVLYMGRKFIKDTKNSHKPKKLKQFALAKRYINFPKFLLVAHTMNAASRQLPSIFFNIQFASAVAGSYMLIQRVIGAPMALIGGAIGDVFRQQASQAYAERGECTAEYISTLKKLVLISSLPFAAFILIAPGLFKIIFGEDWRVAGEYAQILVPMFFLKFLSSPLSNMYLVAEKQKQDLFLSSALFICAAIPFVCALVFSFDIEMVLVIFSILYSLVYLANLFVTFQYSKGAP